MKTFIVSVLLVCIFQLGNANEAVNSALKDLQLLQYRAQTAVDMLKLFTVHYPLILNGSIKAIEDAYQQRADEEVKSILEDIKKKGDSKKVNACYEIAKNRLDELNVDSKKHLEQCTGQTGEEVDLDQAIDSLLNLLSAGKKYLDYIKKLKKDLEETKDESTSDEIVKKIPGLTAKFETYEVSISNEWKRAEQAGKDSEKHAKQCSEKEYADLHTAALVVKQNAFNCIVQA